MKTLLALLFAAVLYILFIGPAPRTKKEDQWKLRQRTTYRRASSLKRNARGGE